MVIMTCIAKRRVRHALILMTKMGKIQADIEKGNREEKRQRNFDFFSVKIYVWPLHYI